MRILYVEDNPANVFLVKRVAKMGNHEIINYIDGGEALRKFPELEPDLVLMDVQLSGELSGLDVVRRLRADGYTTPIIAVTAYAMVGDRERCIEAGCNDYLAKPLPIPRLVEIFEQYEAATTAPASTDASAKPEPVTSESDSDSDASAKPESVTSESDSDSDASAEPESVTSEGDSDSDASAKPESVISESDSDSDASAKPESVTSEGDSDSDASATTAPASTDDNHDVSPPAVVTDNTSEMPETAVKSAENSNDSAQSEQTAPNEKSETSQNTV